MHVRLIPRAPLCPQPAGPSGVEAEEISRSVISGLRRSVHSRHEPPDPPAVVAVAVAESREKNPLLRPSPQVASESYEDRTGRDEGVRQPEQGAQGEEVHGQVDGMADEAEWAVLRQLVPGLQARPQPPGAEDGEGPGDQRDGGDED